jgi:methyl halide transferase
MSLDPSLTIQNFFNQSQEIPVSDKWDTLWHNSHTPWDRGQPSPALVELVVDKQFPLHPSGKSAKALVPGCGRGYDVALFAALTADNQRLVKAVGLDVSSVAVEEARKVHEGKPGTVEFTKGDFFSDQEEWATSGPYDVVYDYTVLPLAFGLTLVSVCIAA